MNGSVSQSAPQQYLKAGRQDLREAGAGGGNWAVEICSVTVIANKKVMGLIQSYGVISSFFPLVLSFHWLQRVLDPFCKMHKERRE